MNVLVTGGAGFIGSHLIRYILHHRPTWRVTNLDLLTYAGNLANLSDISADPRYRFVQGDICDGLLVHEVLGEVDLVLNLAAESHVDRSISAPAPFVRTNVLGTQLLLDASRESGVARFLQVSTDEVYGELPWRDPRAPRGKVKRFSETSPLNPRSPYSASKAAADLLVLAESNIHGSEVVIVRGSNTYGPCQHPEKLIPLMITHGLTGKTMPLYGDGLNVRDWMFVEDCCRGIVLAAEEGRPGEVYNLGGDTERTNLEVVEDILGLLSLPKDAVTFVPDRPGHDRRYAMDFSKATRELGWVPTRRFDDGLADTVQWYERNQDWWDDARRSENTTNTEGTAG
jgi:dTDP-glucose 4,6-dehydratase